MNIRIWFLAAICIMFSKDTFAQQFANSWIKYGQPYIKLSVNEKGIQRISLDSLKKVGLPISQPNHFQLFHRGKQVDLIGVQDNNLLFYGEPNDGALDSLFFRPMNSRINPYFSYYTDLGSYILTVASGPIPLAKSIELPLDKNILPEKYHLEKQVNLANTAKTDYSNGVWQIYEPTPAQSYFADGETMTGPVIVGTDKKTYPMSFINLIVGDSIPLPILEVMINGRNNIGFNINLDIGNRNVNKFAFQGFKGVKSKNTINPFTDLDANQKGIFSLQSLNSGVSTRYSLTYYSISYPQAFNMLGKTTAYYTLTPSTATTSRIIVSNAPKNSEIYDITDPYKVVHLKSYWSDNQLELLVPRNKGKEQKLLVTTDSKTIKKINPVTFKKINPSEFNYVIITNSLLNESVETYSNYRKSTAGGSYKPYIINIDDVYNQFSFGEPHPAGIRNFVDYIVNQGGEDKYLLLVGKHLAPARYIAKEIPNEIPTVGFPGSDVLLVSGLNNFHPDVEVIPVGRISASTNQQVLDYLAKVKEFELGNISDRKNVLHLNGGKSASEISQFRDMLSSLTPLVENSGGIVTPFVKKSNLEVEPVVIYPEVNNGVGLITYFGHGSPTVTDLDFGYASKSERNYENKGKYPLMYFNGCGVGNIFNSYANPLSTDWVLTKDKGAVAVIANSHLSYYSSSAGYIQALYKEIFSSNNSITNPMTIGRIHQNVALNITQKATDPYQLSNLHQALLQGDPALKITFSNLPDYAINSSKIFIQSKNLNETIEDSDSLNIKVITSNLGKLSSTDNLLVRVNILYTNSQLNVTKSATISRPNTSDTLTITTPNNGKIQKVIVTLDPNNSIKETDKANNISDVLITWDNIKSLKSYPEYELLDTVAPLIFVKQGENILVNKQEIAAQSSISLQLIDNRYLDPEKSKVQLFIKNCWDDTCDFIELPQQFYPIASNGLNSITFEYPLMELPKGQYELLVRGTDNSSIASAPYRVQFKVIESNNLLKELIVSPNPASNYVQIKSNILSADNQTIEMEINIYDNHGRVVKADLVILNPGTNEWYWDAIENGTFVYTLKYRWKNGQTHDRSGRIVVIR